MQGMQTPECPPPAEQSRAKKMPVIRTGSFQSTRRSVVYFDLATRLVGSAARFYGVFIDGSAGLVFASAGFDGLSVHFAARHVCLSARLDGVFIEGSARFVLASAGFDGVVGEHSTRNPDGGNQNECV